MATFAEIKCPTEWAAMAQAEQGVRDAQAALHAAYRTLTNAHNALTAAVRVVMDTPPAPGGSA
jgi:hypothetical protein